MDLEADVQQSSSTTTTTNEEPLLFLHHHHKKSFSNKPKKIIVKMSSSLDEDGDSENSYEAILPNKNHSTFSNLPPTSPECLGKSGTTNTNNTAKNAPSPRTIPRSLSRSSEEIQRIGSSGSGTSTVSYNHHKPTSHRRILADQVQPDVNVPPNIWKPTNLSLAEEGDPRDAPMSSRPRKVSSSSHVSYYSTMMIESWPYSGDRVGAYDLDARKARIERYREKRKQLSFRQVRYSARSNICQKRERRGGRFVKTNQIIRADIPTLMNHAPSEQDEEEEQQQLLDTNELASVAELMVGLSRSQATNTTTTTSPSTSSDS